MMMPITELPVAYGERPAGSVSKLRTYSDGLRILRTIVALTKSLTRNRHGCITAVPIAA